MRLLTVLALLCALLLVRGTSGGLIGGFISGILSRGQQQQTTQPPALTTFHQTTLLPTIQPTRQTSKMKDPVGVGDSRRAINAPPCPDGEIADDTGKCRPNV